MNSIKNIIATAVVAFALSGCSTAHATETTMKPLQGASFHAGSMHAAGYFLNESKTCKLVLTFADDLNYAPTRVEAAIGAGESAQYQLAEGKSLEFACQAEAQSMSVRSLEATAANN
jgi:hypothetical protein